MNYGIGIERLNEIEQAIDALDRSIEKMFDAWRMGDEGLNYYSIYALQDHARKVRTDLSIVRRGHATYHQKQHEHVTMV